MLFELPESRVEQVQPAGEMSESKAWNREVLEHRIARELAAVVKDGAPKFLHSRQMRGPVGDPLGKDRPEQRVVANIGVKRLDQMIDKRGIHSDLFRGGALLGPLALSVASRVCVRFANG